MTEEKSDYLKVTSSTVLIGLLWCVIPYVMHYLLPSDYTFIGTNEFLVVILNGLILFFIFRFRKISYMSHPGSKLKNVPHLVIIGLSLFVLLDAIYHIRVIMTGGRLTDTNLTNEAIFYAWRSSLKVFQIISLFVLTVVVYPVFEEFFFRGFILTNLKIGDKLSMILGNLLFALSHAGSTITQYLSHFIFGIIVSNVFLRTRNIWIPIVIHSVSNLTWFGIKILLLDSYLGISAWRHFEVLYWSIVVASSLMFIACYRRVVNSPN